MVWEKVVVLLFKKERWPVCCVMAFGCLDNQIKVQVDSKKKKKHEVNKILYPVTFRYINIACFTKSPGTVYTVEINNSMKPHDPGRLRT